jgi:hypothetical protein
MKGFLDRVKGSASKVMQSVANAASELAELSFSSNMDERPPQDEVYEAFKSLCAIIDELAGKPDAGTTDADRALYESKAREHVRDIIGLMQLEGDDWLVHISKPSTGETFEMPCLDVFLQMNMMHELAKRATADLPRGTLPLVLGTTSSLLRNVRYPLLPHTIVHKPIVKLISMASRFDALNTGESLSSSAARAELASYKKRIDIGLTTLIGIVWRKIAENPPILEFFTLTDVSRGGASSKLIQSQMDVISALIPLMGKPAVGPYAKKGLLIAVSMRDWRVDTFIMQNTRLVQNIISELSRRFFAAIEALIVGGNSSNSGYRDSSILSPLAMLKHTNVPSNMGIDDMYGGGNVSFGDMGDEPTSQGPDSHGSLKRPTSKYGMLGSFTSPIDKALTGKDPFVTPSKRYL